MVIVTICSEINKRNHLPNLHNEKHPNQSGKITTKKTNMSQQKSPCLLRTVFFCLFVSMGFYLNRGCQGTIWWLAVRKLREGTNLLIVLVCTAVFSIHFSKKPKKREEFSSFLLNGRDHETLPTQTMSQFFLGKIYNDIIYMAIYYI